MSPHNQDEKHNSAVTLWLLTELQKAPSATKKLVLNVLSPPTTTSLNELSPQIPSHFLSAA